MNTNRQIWYGANGQNVAFSENKAALADAGIQNPKSFTVTPDGDVTGLELIGSNTNQHGGQPQTA